MDYQFHKQVQEFYPDFNYRNPRPDVKERQDMRRPDNVVGHQQRAVSTYWALQKCSPVDLGLDLGSPKGMTPHCIHIDIFGDGRVHPFYGGGRYLSDVVQDAASVGNFPQDAWPFVNSNHSLEHMNVLGDAGVIDVLKRWIGLLRQDGILVLVIPDNAHFDVMASDKDHRHAWSAGDFRGRVLDQVLSSTAVELVEYDTLQNHFSFDAILRKR